MYLSKLEILGFKSFAQKTLLRFNSGITAIVGPNGCGKTNIVDAIRWALGEQRPSLLRSDAMSDVIFNGTRARKPLGMSEVSLTIENNDGVLPTEFSEVTITRRVFRSNESEYLLNKTQCRLKDIVDLFMDTGMSANAYSVIELKMIELILSERTEERRKLFEEAAGVTKYKARRREALRKLQDVEQDLTRVNDIVKEIEKKVHQLERQAEKAKLYKQLADELRVKEVDLLEREYAGLLTRIEPLENQFTSTETLREALDKEILLQEESLKGVQEELDEIEARLRHAQQQMSSRAERVNQTEQGIAVAEERSRASHDLVERASAEIAELEEYRATLTQKIQVVEQSIASLQQSMQEAAGLELAAAGELDGMRATLSAARGDLQIAQSRVIEAINTIGGHTNRIDQARDRLAGLNTQLERLELNRRNLSGELARVGSERESLSGVEDELRATHVEMENMLHSQQDRKEQLKAELDGLQNASFEIQNTLGKKLSKIEFLTNLVEHSTGYSEGVQYLLQSEEWHPGMRVTVADVFAAEQAYRPAIEAALGDAARYVIVPTRAAAAAAISVLQQHHKGKATLVCLENVPATLPLASGLPQDPHVFGWARSLVRSDEAYKPLADTLLDGIAVVEDLDTAWRIIQDGLADACATLDGELVTRRGVIRGGSRKQSEGALIGKREQIDELGNEVNALHAQLEDVQSRIAGLNAEYLGIDLNRHAAELRAAQQALASWEKQFAQLEVAQRKTEETLDYSSDGEREIRGEVLRLEALLAEAEPQLEGALEEKRAADAHVMSCAQALSAIEQSYGEATQRANDAHVRSVQAQSEHQNFVNERARITEALQSSAATMEKRRGDIQRATEDITRLTQELEELRLALESQRAEYQASAAEASAIGTELSDRRTHVQGLIDVLREKRRTYDTSLSATHEIEMRISKLRMQTDQVVQRAKEEFELSLEQKAFEDMETFSIGETREQVQQMKRKLRSLEPVNHLAYEEWEQEKERLAFLHQQQKDLVESQKTLTATIIEINETAQGKFQETFQQIRTNFTDIFKTLFTEGDEADIMLSQDVDDPLEAPIEIMAKPSGKRPHSIDLLSAGEKTLTAIALLFAIYLVKPSPFCILDEVDAPLDDANIDRFIRILRRFSNRTQFIVVTHNKRTMEAADTMYGVTMEEEGISKIVSVRFSEAKETTTGAAAA